METSGIVKTLRNVDADRPDKCTFRCRGHLDLSNQHHQRCTSLNSELRRWKFFTNTIIQWRAGWNIFLLYIECRLWREQQTERIKTLYTLFYMPPMIKSDTNVFVSSLCAWITEQGKWQGLFSQTHKSEAGPRCSVLLSLPLILLRHAISVRARNVQKAIIIPWQTVY